MINDSHSDLRVFVRSMFLNILVSVQEKTDLQGKATASSWAKMRPISKTLPPDDNSFLVCPE